MSETEPRRAERALLIFLDGVGLGPSDSERNPFLSGTLPTFDRLMGGIPTLATRGGARAPAELGSGRGCWTPADACFDVPGLPQSGTGQTALLTGVRAPVELGRHFGPWVPTQLRGMLATENLLSRAVARGWPAAFANATPAAQAGGSDGAWRRPAAAPLAAHGAGLQRRDLPELRARRAVASSISNEKWQEYADPTLPDISPSDAGGVLAAIAAAHTVTLFAHYDTDHVGHTQDLQAAVGVLERIDAFLGGLLSEMDSDTLLVIASDHGNVEDVTGGHTVNPVPVIAHGPGADRLVSSVLDIAGVTPAILRELDATRI